MAATVTKGEIERTKQAGLVLLGYLEQLLGENPRLKASARQALANYRNPIVDKDVDYTLVHVGRLANVFGIADDYR